MNALERLHHLTRKRPRVLDSPSCNDDLVEIRSDSHEFKRPSHWFRVLDEWIKIEQKRRKTEDKNLTIRTREDVCIKSFLQVASLGDRRLKKMEYDLRNMGVELTNVQQQFVRVMINGLLPWIYGAEWEAECQRVMKERGMQQHYPLNILTAPRRIGKTWIVAMLTATAALRIPGFQILIFSCAQRQSGSLSEWIQRYLSRLPDSQNRIAKNNKEDLYISARPVERGVSKQKEHQIAFDTSIIRSLPGGTNCT